MALISQENQDLLRDKFDKELGGDVSVTVFTEGDSTPGSTSQDCQFCKETKQLMEEIAGLSPKIHLQVADIASDHDRASQLGVDKVPAIVVDGAGTAGIKYYGIPSGYEFGSLIEDIVDVSKGETNLSDQTKQALQGLGKDVHIQVFVTAT